jgi:hypothetical protein
VRRILSLALMLAVAVPSFPKARSRHLSRREILQFADCMTRLGVGKNASGHNQMQLQYRIIPDGYEDENRRTLADKIEVMLHGPHAGEGEYFEFELHRSAGCLHLRLVFSADVSRYDAGPLRGMPAVDNATSGMGGVTDPIEEDLAKYILPSPLYIVSAKDIHKTCAELTSIDRRFPLELNGKEQKRGTKKCTIPETFKNHPASSPRREPRTISTVKAISVFSVNQR